MKYFWPTVSNLEKKKLFEVVAVNDKTGMLSKVYFL